MLIQLNEVKIDVNIEVDDVNDDGLKEMKFSFVAKNETEYHLYKTLIHSKTLSVKTGADDQEVEFRVKSNSYTLKNESYEEVPFSVTLVESSAEEEWSIATGTAAVALESKLRITTLKELLIEKEIFTNEELQKKFAEVVERDRDKNITYLTTGKQESTESEQD